MTYVSVNQMSNREPLVVQEIATLRIKGPEPTDTEEGMTDRKGERGLEAS